VSPNVHPLSRIDRAEGPLSSADVWSFEAYAAARRELVSELIALKRTRRVRAGEHCSLVFESRATVWFQVHEELHLHTGDRQARAHELLRQYAPLVPRRGELCGSLFLECAGVVDVRALSLHLGQNIRSLSVVLPTGHFHAHPLESLSHGIPGVAFLRFVQDETRGTHGIPSLRWAAPLYPVVSQLPRDVVRALTVQLEGERLRAGHTLH
jgi:hypothetical protein